MLKSILLAVCIATGLAAPVQAAASTLAEYRGVTLGQSVPVVVAALRAQAADVKVISDRPSLVQELTWRPDRFLSGQIAAPDSLGEMILTFHENRLVRIVATYDRERTAGMTEADFQEVMSAAYGPSALLSNAAWANPQPAPQRKAIGRWEDRDTLVILWSERYPERTGLVISALPGDALMQVAMAAGRRAEADEAPAREAALRVSNAAALKARNEKIRLENKAAFKP